VIDGFSRADHEVIPWQKRDALQPIGVLKTTDAGRFTAEWIISNTSPKGASSEGVGGREGLRTSGAPGG
jgi:hypothetical protein